MAVEKMTEILLSLFNTSRNFFSDGGGACIPDNMMGNKSDRKKMTGENDGKFPILDL